MECAVYAGVLGDLLCVRDADLGDAGDEIRFYNALHLCLLFFGAGLCIAGVIIFATKHSSKKKIIE